MSDRKTESISFVAAGTVSGSSVVTGKDISAYDELNIYVNVTSAGTTLDVTVQDSPDGANYYTLATMDQISATGNYVQRITGNIGQHVRVSYNAVGTWGLSIIGLPKT